MEKETLNQSKYNPPEIEIFGEKDLFEKFGPVLSCSGFGGAVTEC
jgi:hypothetical protein